MTTYWTLLLILLAAEIPVSQAVFDYATESDLRTLIFTTNGYRIQTRPAETVDVSITFSILTFNTLDVRAQSLTTTGYFELSWYDSRLEWSNHSTYSRIFVIYSNEDTVWRPPLILSNSVNDISVMSDSAIPIRILLDGTITWTPAGIYQTLCETDVTYYPFDTQVCDITISTWGYTSTEISLYFDSSPVDTTYFTENGEWEFTSSSTSTTTNQRRGKSFSSLTFHMNLKRRPMYHVLNTLTPTILLAFLSCMAFKLPPESGERIGYSLTVLLSYAVYLTLVSTNIPTTSVNTSLLSVYLVLILALGMVSVLLTILVLECHHTDPEKKVPKWLLNILNFLMMITFQKRKSDFRCCCLPGQRKNDVETLETPNQQQKDKTPTKDGSIGALATNNYVSGTTYTWIEIGQHLDKSFLRLFLFIVLVSTMAFTLTLGIVYAIG
ncbi:acetylcholine receptor subunit delta-like [Pecten maximus]|uniref:acetylcholine receptor subunit delta-like n=1 Tax=Pecten maximus TaxID=6579 RepID=UPI001458664B|nr:acetylcholine receptor subunit delta-like [Pecten maximus]